MSLNDPFGRVSRRQKHAYRQFREQLRQQDVVTPGAVQQAKRHLHQTSLRLVAIVVVAAAIGGILFLELRALITVTAVLVLLWLGSSYLQTRGHLNTYARELSDAGALDARHNADKSTEEDNPS